VIAIIPMDSEDRHCRRPWNGLELVRLSMKLKGTEEVVVLFSKDFIHIVAHSIYTSYPQPSVVFL
jgi:hypothetical protein